MNPQPLVDLGSEKRARMHAALGDVHRLAIVDALTASDLSPSQLGRDLDLPSNLLAHHLEVLEDAGVIRRHPSTADGRRRYITLDRQALTILNPAPRLPCSVVLFVCSGNSARSQMAAALWNHLTPTHAESAGTQPSPRVHPLAIQAAGRVGLDLSGASPRSLADVSVRPDLVITVCDHANEELARVEAQRLHWSVPDPASQGRAADFDAALDLLRQRIESVAPYVISPH